MNRSFSLSYLTAPVDDPFEALTIAQGAGYAHLGLRLRDPLEGGAASPLVGNAPLQREMNRRLADAGVTVIEIEAWMLLAGRPVRGDEAVFEAAAALGAPRLIAVGDRAGAIGMPELCERFADLCEQASAFGLGVGFEPIAHRSGGRIEDALRVVEAGAPWGAGLVLDTLHINRMGIAPDALRRIDPALLHTIQLCDAPAAAPDLETMIDHSAFNRWVPGEGALPLRDYLLNLPQDRPLALEIPMQRLAGRAPPAERARWSIEAARRLLETL